MPPTTAPARSAVCVRTAHARVSLHGEESSPFFFLLLEGRCWCWVFYCCSRSRLHVWSGVEERCKSHLHTCAYYHQQTNSYSSTPAHTHPQVTLDAQSTKVSVLPALLNHLETATGGAAGGAGTESLWGNNLRASVAPTQPPLPTDMAYVDPSLGFSEVRVIKKWLVSVRVSAGILMSCAQGCVGCGNNLRASVAPTQPPLPIDMAYVDPSLGFSEVRVIKKWLGSVSEWVST